MSEVFRIVFRFAFRFVPFRCVNHFFFLRFFLFSCFFFSLLSRTRCKKKDRMASLEADYERVAASYNAAAKRFGEDPTKVPSGDFFALVSVRFMHGRIAVKEA